MAKQRKPGRTLEILTARIEHALSDSGVTIKSPDHLEDKVAGGTREVDVSLRTDVGSAEVVVIVECRDRGRVADVTWIEQIVSKRDAVGASKAIAVSSGTFSKKALATARNYGIDAITLKQVNDAEVRKWTGGLELFEESAILENPTISIKLGGPEPLPKEITDSFDQLVHDRNFDAAFISLAGQEGLFSPRDVVRRSRPGILAGKPVKITVPPKSGMFISEDPLSPLLAGRLPEDGSSVERHHTIEFAEGDAFFSFGGELRTLLSVRLNCSMRLKSSTPIQASAYRYSSPRAVIEVATRTVDLGGQQLTVLEHRTSAADPESKSRLPQRLPPQKP